MLPTATHCLFSKFLNASNVTRSVNPDLDNRLNSFSFRKLNAIKLSSKVKTSSGRVFDFRVSEDGSLSERIIEYFSEDFRREEPVFDIKEGDSVDPDDYHIWFGWD